MLKLFKSHKISRSFFCCCTPSRSIYLKGTDLDKPYNEQETNDQYMLTYYKNYLLTKEDLPEEERQSLSKKVEEI